MALVAESGVGGGGRTSTSSSIQESTGSASGYYSHYPPSFHTSSSSSSSFGGGSGNYMKTDWSCGSSMLAGGTSAYSPCQYGGPGGSTQPPPPPAHTSMYYPTSHHHHHHQHHSHHHTHSSSSSSSSGGHYHPPLEMRCNCSHPPNERTILHGILTGRGYKFGYGGGSAAAHGTSALDAAPFFGGVTGGSGASSASYHDVAQQPFYMGIDPLDAHSK